jgi:hypothetical protein
LKRSSADYSASSRKGWRTRSASLRRVFDVKRIRQTIL